MDSSTDRTEVKSRAKRSYDVAELIWPDTDAWSSFTKKTIEDFIARAIKGKGGVILNAGCGGNEYCLPAHGKCINVDISLRQCKGLQSAVVADIEALPFKEEFFDVVVCVGAVLNYSEPYASIPELFRVAKSGGRVVIDFETTNSAEILFTPGWGKQVSVIERDYAGRVDKTFLFSSDYIQKVVKSRKQNNHLCSRAPRSAAKNSRHSHVGRCR
jgi:ubiquinone/menaquinone biosynthesis C-methylase UbiE